MKIKHSRLLVAAVVTGSSLLSSLSSLPASALTQSCTWVGTAGDNIFSTATNWSGCGGGVPQNGDIAVFDSATVAPDPAPKGVITNDTNPQLSKVTFNNSNINSGKTLYLSQLTLAGSGLVETTGTSSYIKIGTPTSNPDIDNLADIVVRGDYHLTNNIMFGYNFKGLSVDGMLSLDANSSDYDIGYNVVTNTAGSLLIAKRVTFGAGSSTQTLSTPMTLNDGAMLGFGGVSFGDGASWSVTSPLTINSSSPVQVTVYDGSSVSFVGSGADPAKLVKSSVSLGALIVGNTTQQITAKTTDITGKNETGMVGVGVLETAIMAADAVRSRVVVLDGGTLKGNGTVLGATIIEQGGKLSPGNSPGCHITGTLSLGGEYIFELGGVDPCTGYDQIQVTNTTQSSPTVILGAEAALSTSLYNKFVPKKDQTYTIISVAGSQPVQGTFKELVEGATFTQNGVLFKITYKGGDGNDVVLTVLGTPGIPNTGFELVRTNPVLTAIAASFAALMLIVVGRKLQLHRR
jgi:hypothetical protein